MPNIIKAEHDASQTMTITLASLADTNARQSDMVDNTDNAQMIRIYFKVTTGTSPDNFSPIEFYLLTGNLDAIRTDNAGANDASITIDTAPIVNIIQVSSSSNITYRGSFLIRNPGIEWGIAIKNETGASLNSTGSNHEMTYVVENMEVQ